MNIHLDKCNVLHELQDLHNNILELLCVMLASTVNIILIALKLYQIWNPKTSNDV